MTYSPDLFRRVTMCCLLAWAACLLPVKPAAAQADDAPPAAEWQWHDARQLTVDGRGYDDTARFFDRWPARAEGVVRPPVWSLSRHSAGMAIRFVTAAPRIACRWQLYSNRLSMAHMAATGVSGVDLYGRDAAGAWQWIACGRPSQFPTNEQVLAAELPPGQREYMLYLPLYNGVETVEIGLPPATEVAAAPAGKKPIVFYGTSIMQGACASRPGMAHSAILGRRFDHPIINLGFSGNGRMEPEVAQLLAELDPAVYVIDALPNMTAAEISERAAPLVRTLRQARPGTPIVLVEDRTYADAPWTASRLQRNQSSRAAFRQAYQTLLAEGVEGLHYVEGESLLGADRDDTVDGSHPTDLGFYRMADALEPVLKPLLPGRN